MLVKFIKNYLGIKKGELRDISEQAYRALLSQNVIKAIDKPTKDKMLRTQKIK